MAKKASTKQSEQESSITTAEDVELFFNGEIISAAEINRQIEEDDAFRRFLLNQNLLERYKKDMKQQFALALHSPAVCLVLLEPENLLVQAGLQVLAGCPAYNGINLRDQFEVFVNYWRTFYRKVLGMNPVTIAASEIAPGYDYGVKDVQRLTGFLPQTIRARVRAGKDFYGVTMVTKKFGRDIRFSNDSFEALKKAVENNKKEEQGWMNQRQA
ncbi:MAG: hypothetical protein ACHQNE_04210 [Candidatus Kapaibacterium sp.]